MYSSVKKFVEDVNSKYVFDFINVYFEHWSPNTFPGNWNIEPIGFSLIKNKKSTFEREIWNLNPELKFISVKEGKDRKFKDLKDGQVYKLIITSKAQEFGDSIYYPSTLVPCNLSVEQIEKVSGKIENTLTEFLDIDPEI